LWPRRSGSGGSAYQHGFDEDPAQSSTAAGLYSQVRAMEISSSMQSIRWHRHPQVTTNNA
jgi:hypothetical protein